MRYCSFFICAIYGYFSFRPPDYLPVPLQHICFGNRSVCWACGRQAYRFHVFRKESLIQRMCLFSCGKNSLYIRFRKDDVKVIRYCATYTAILRTAYLTACKHVPKSNSMAQTKLSPALDVGRNFLAQNRTKHSPEAVLRVHIVKALLP